MKKFGYLLSVMMICGGCLFGCGNANNDEEVKEPQTHEETESVKEAREQTEQQQEQKEVEVPIVETPQVYRFGLNETVPMTTTYGDYEITFTDNLFKEYAF